MFSSSGGKIPVGSLAYVRRRVRRGRLKRAALFASQAAGLFFLLAGAQLGRIPFLVVGALLVFGYPGVLGLRAMRRDNQTIKAARGDVVRTGPPATDRIA